MDSSHSFLCFDFCLWWNQKIPPSKKSRWMDRTGNILLRNYIHSCLHVHISNLHTFYIIKSFQTQLFWIVTRKSYCILSIQLYINWIYNFLSSLHAKKSIVKHWFIILSLIKEVRILSFVWRFHVKWNLYWYQNSQKHIGTTLKLLFNSNESVKNV